jgi:ribose 5-phosphate isomerase B
MFGGVLMKIALGSDHGGLNLKKAAMEYLNGRKIEFKDFGSFTSDSCDYPDFGLAVAEAVVSGEYDLGIIVCGTGIGISMTANKVPGIRAAHCTDSYSARMARAHNNANILAMGERITGPGIAIDIIEAFLSTDFEGGRHAIRVNKITEVEKKYSK